MNCPHCGNSTPKMYVEVLPPPAGKDQLCPMACLECFLMALRRGVSVPARPVAPSPKVLTH